MQEAFHLGSQSFIPPLVLRCSWAANNTFVAGVIVLGHSVNDLRPASILHVKESRSWLMRALSSRLMSLWRIAALTLAWKKRRYSVMVWSPAMAQSTGERCTSSAKINVMGDAVSGTCQESVASGDDSHANRTLEKDETALHL